MTEIYLPGLLVAALGLGAFHTLAPDHWLPFAAIGRARGWSTGRTGAIAVLAGLGHLAVSAVLGLLALTLGAVLMESWGTRLESLAGLLLLGFGAAYAVFGLQRAMRRRLPAEDDTASEARASRLTVGGLLVLFAVDPCVPLIPLVASAATLGMEAALAVILTYGTATLAGMASLTCLAHRGARRLPLGGPWRHALAGALILSVGVVVKILGI